MFYFFHSKKLFVQILTSADKTIGFDIRTVFKKMAGAKRKVPNYNAARSSHGADSDSDETSVSATDSFNYLQNQDKGERLLIRKGYRQLMDTLVGKFHFLVIFIIA